MMNRTKVQNTVVGGGKRIHSGTRGRINADGVFTTDQSDVIDSCMYYQPTGTQVVLQVLLYSKNIRLYCTVRTDYHCTLAHR